jgi:hypothetical protein
MKAKVDAIAAHGINCFVNRQLIYNYPESLLTEKGIMTIEHADFEGVERLSLVTGGEIASTFERPDLVQLGHCELIEEIMIGEDKASPAGYIILHSFLTKKNHPIPSSSSSLVLQPVKRAPLSYVDQQIRWWTRPSGPCTMRSRFSRRL